MGGHFGVLFLSDNPAIFVLIIDFVQGFYYYLVGSSRKPGRQARSASRQSISVAEQVTELLISPLG